MFFNFVFVYNAPDLFMIVINWFLAYSIKCVYMFACILEQLLSQNSEKRLLLVFLTF